MFESFMNKSKPTLTTVAPLKPGSKLNPLAIPRPRVAPPKPVEPIKSVAQPRKSGDLNFIPEGKKGVSMHEVRKALGWDQELRRKIAQRLKIPSGNITLLNEHIKDIQSMLDRYDVNDKGYLRPEEVTRPLARTGAADRRKFVQGTVEGGIDAAEKLAIHRRDEKEKILKEIVGKK